MLIAFFFSAESVRLDRGHDLVDLITHAKVYEDDEERLDYSERKTLSTLLASVMVLSESHWLLDMVPSRQTAGSFRVVVLRKGGVVVSVATMRVFGTLFAEIPFVATKDGYRKDGHCRRLISVSKGGGTCPSMKCWSFSVVDRFLLPCPSTLRS